MVNPLHRLAVVSRLRPENAADEGLWIAIVQRKPTGLDLQHDPVTREEDVVRRGQREAVQEGLMRRDRFGCLEALAIAAAENVGRYHQLITSQGRLGGYLVGVDVDQLDHPIRVRAARRGYQVGNRLPANLHWPAQRIGDECHHVGATGRLSLVVDEPLGPGQAVTVAHRLNGPGAKGDRLGRIGNVLLEFRIARLWRGEAQRQAGGEIERRRLDRATVRAASRPGGQALPRVGAGFECRYWREISLWRAVLEVLVEKRAQDLPPKVERRIAVKL